MMDDRKIMTKSSTIISRNFRFWGRATLEAVGIILIVSVGLFVFYSMENADISSNQAIREALTVFPYYLYLGGGFSVLMMAIGYFQVYFSLLVSMNSKRKAVAAGILISTFLLIVFVNGGAWLLWSILDTETADMAVRLIPVLTGISLLTGAFSIVLGVIITRWGKIGTIILTATCMIVGGLVGAGILAVDGVFEIMLGLAEKSLWTAAAAGMALYILSGVFAMLSVRKAEIRS